MGSFELLLRTRGLFSPVKRRFPVFWAIVRSTATRMGYLYSLGYVVVVEVCRYV